MASRVSAFQPPSPTAAFNALYSSVLFRLNSLNIDSSSIDNEQKPYLVFTITKLQSFAEPMASLVTDFFVNPVIRQAQRIRSGSINESEADDHDKSPRIRRPSRDVDAGVPIDEGAISETDEALALLRHIAGEGEDHGPGSHSPSGQSDFAELRSAAHALSQASSHSDNLPRRSSQSSVHILVPDEDISQDHSVSRSNSSDSVTPQLLVPKMKPQPIPEDDGMGAMRRRILEIQAQDVDQEQKAHLMHQLFQENHAKTCVNDHPHPPKTPSGTTSWQQRLAQGPLESLKFWQNTMGENSPVETFTLTDLDVKPTYVPCESSHTHEEDGLDRIDEFERPFGCEHYMRNVKLQCSTCSRWYTCRFCHDRVEDHELVRKDTKNMLCMYCGTAQRASDSCVTCSASAACYYCDICKLWNNDPSKDIYHCDDCGICRIGKGIGKDFFHCKKCRACIAINKQKDHKCVERATDCDCPICGEYMFTSPKPVGFLDCGHSIHQACFQDHMRTSYKCPICNKSAINMEYQFRSLDRAIEQQPMPPEFDRASAIILCNDCSAKSQVKYHWLGLKCDVCRSYNTAQLQVLGMESVGSNESRPEGLPPPLSRNLDQSEVVPGDVAHASETRPRRHSSSTMRAPMAGLHRLQTSGERLPHRSSTWSASVCPTPLTAEEDEQEDFLGLWNLVPRGFTSDDEPEGSEDSDAETESSSEEEEMEEDDEEDVDDWEIFGHR